MQNLIIYYYSLKNVQFSWVDGKLFCKDNFNTYYLERIFDLSSFLQVYNLVKDDYRYDKILLNVYGDLYFEYQNNYYVLIKKNLSKLDFVDDIVSCNQYLNNNYYTVGSNWISLWQAKLDYYEYYYQHINGKSQLIDESFSYYLGMGETAISYLTYNLDNFMFPLVISHNRIDFDNYFNPLNVILDYRARDVCQYLKFLFFENLYNNFNFYEFFLKLNFSRSDWILLYARLFFPCFYFDLYDGILNKKSENAKLVSVIVRSSEYEQYISMIYNVITNIVDIPPINWI